MIFKGKFRERFWYSERKQAATGFGTWGSSETLQPD